MNTRRLSLAAGFVALGAALVAVVLAGRYGLFDEWGESATTTPLAAGGHQHHGGGPPADGQAEKPILGYACPMNCVPPLPEPGLCPVCGMDMKPVEAGDGGGDLNVPRLVMSEASKALANVQTAVVERRPAELTLRMTGMVDYDETRVKAITAWTPGRIERLFVDQTGIPVAKGDDLFTIYSTALATVQSDLLVALGSVREEASSHYSLEQRQELLESSRRALRLNGLTDEQIAAIEEAGRARSVITIRAPISGTVLEKNAEEGIYVQEGTRLYRIADLSRLWVHLDAYESDLPFLRYGQRVAIRTEAYGDEVFPGRISFIDPMVNAMTRTTKVRVVVENPDRRLKPGMYVRADVEARIDAAGRARPPAELAGKWISPRHPEVIRDQPGDCPICGIDLVPADEVFAAPKAAPTGYARDPLVVPASAVLYTGARGVVYVQEEADPPTFVARTVTLGPRVGDRYVVRAGLESGERVAVNGAFRIDSALQIAGRPSMMRPEGVRRGVDPSSASGTESEAGVEAREAEDGSTASQPADPHGVDPVARIETPAAFRAGLAEVVKRYYAIQQALGQDDWAEARTAVEALQAAVAEVPTEGLSPEASRAWGDSSQALGGLGLALLGAEEIESARAIFSPLSHRLETVARRFGPLPGVAIRRAFCPMAFDDQGAYWLQPTAQILNPYEGSRMPRCGRIVEELQP